MQIKSMIQKIIQFSLIALGVMIFGFFYHKAHAYGEGSQATSGYIFSNSPFPIFSLECGVPSTPSTPFSLIAFSGDLTDYQNNTGTNIASFGSGSPVDPLSPACNGHNMDSLFGNIDGKYYFVTRQGTTDVNLYAFTLTSGVWSEGFDDPISEIITLSAWNSVPISADPRDPPVTFDFFYTNYDNQKYIKLLMIDMDNPSINSFEFFPLSCQTSPCSVPEAGAFTTIQAYTGHRYSGTMWLSRYPGAQSYASDSPPYSFSDLTTTGYTPPIFDPNPQNLPSECSLTSTSSITNCFTNIFNNIKTKIPFSYIYEINTIIAGLGSGSASLPTVNIDFLGSNITVFSSTTFFSFISPTSQALIKSLATAIIWFVFAWAVFHRVKRLLNKSEV